MSTLTSQDFLNSKPWCHRVVEYAFKKYDADGDGYISPEDRKTSRARFLDYAQKQPGVEEAHEKHKAATDELMSTFGTTETDRVSKDEWLKKVAEIAAADLERIKNGEEPLLGQTVGPFFDIMDTDKDGFITLEEFKRGYEAIGWDAVSAEQAFKYLDCTNLGRISREEILKSSNDFWYRIEHYETAEDFLNSEPWCHKMVEYIFKKRDIDCDGYISPEDRKALQARFSDYAQKQPGVEEAHEKHKAAIDELTSTFGITETDRVSKDEWLKKVAEITVADLERIKNGEESLLGQAVGPFFDIMDTDKDGFITLEEFKRGYEAIGWDAVSAEQAFKYLDNTNSGKISRECYVKISTDFWYT